MTQHSMRGLGLILFYVVARMASDSWWQGFSVWASYAFELAFVLFCFWIYRARVSWVLENGRWTWLGGAAAIVVGLGVRWFAGFTRLNVPFDFTAAETLVAALVIAPILEEGIYRVAIWEGAKDWFRNDAMVLAFSALLFSFGHLMALAFVPEEFRGFIYYQGAYVLFLGLACGWVRLRCKSPFAPMFLHFGFNAGFVLGNWI